jgi:hypothetical protein
MAITMRVHCKNPIDKRYVSDAFRASSDGGGAMIIRTAATGFEKAFRIHDYRWSVVVTALQRTSDLARCGVPEGVGEINE